MRKKDKIRQFSMYDHKSFAIAWIRAEYCRLNVACYLNLIQFKINYINNNDNNNCCYCCCCYTTKTMTLIMWNCCSACRRT